MRLIDADSLIELMIKDRDYAGENGFMDMFCERQHLIGVIKNQPTAYDVDKVVEQLENEKSRFIELCLSVNDIEKKEKNISSRSRL